MLGDGVNIAARIEPLAQSCGICVSQDVARQIQNKIDMPLQKIDTAQLKNIKLPVDIYAVGSYLFNNNGTTVTDYTADVVRVKVHDKWVDMAKVGRAPCENPDLERVW